MAQQLLALIASRSIALVTIAVLADATPAAAETGVWTSLGPDGSGEVMVVLAPPQQPGTVYAGMYGGGFFMSEDYGESWRSMADGLASSWFGDLIMTPEGTLHAATDRGVFRWEAEASSWRRISEGLPERQYFSCLAVDPTDSNILYTTATYGYSGTGQLYRTTDGEHWARVPGASLDRRVAIAPTSPPTLLAGGSLFGDFLRSRNGGLTWQSSTVGLPEDLFTIFSDILVDPASPTTIYASVGAYDDRPALPYKSLNGGVTWALAAQGITPGHPSYSGGRLAADPVRPGELLWGGSEGVFRSSDSGESWQPVNSALADREVHDLAIGPNGFYFAAVDRSYSGVLRSRDQGASWHSLEDGLSASVVRALSPDPEIPGRLIAGADRAGLLVSDNDGNDWRRITNGNPGSTSVVRDLDTPSTLYVTGGEAGLYRSLDSGNTWHRIGPTYPEFFSVPVQPVAQDPSATNTLYVAAHDEVWRSLDGGDRWQLLGRAPCPLGLTLAPPAGDGTLLGGCYRRPGYKTSPPAYESALLRSPDGGVTWEEILRSGNPEGTWSFAPGLSPGTMLASLESRFYGFSGGAFRTDDSGATWTEIESLRKIPVRATLADPDSGEIFAATGRRGVLRSVDDGVTWQPFNKGLASGSVHALVLDPHVPGRLWAGTSAGAHRLDRTEVQVDPCRSSTSLCLLNRFRAEVSWEDFDGNTGVGTAVPLTSTTGTFWFFDEANTELVVKVLDGRGVNDSFWVFYAGLSTVKYTLTVTDLLTGRQRVFENPAGRLSSGADIGAFPDAGVDTGPSVATGPSAKAASPLVLGDGRFLIEVAWQTPQGESGSASGWPLSEESGVLWFFEPTNLELFLKILDGRPINGHFWLFFGALSNVGFELTVTDLETGASRRYTNPVGTFASQVDLESF